MPKRNIAREVYGIIKSRNLTSTKSHYPLDV